MWDLAAHCGLGTWQDSGRRQGASSCLCASWPLPPMALGTLTLESQSVRRCSPLYTSSPPLNSPYTAETHKNLLQIENSETEIQGEEFTLNTQA